MSNKPVYTINEEQKMQFAGIFVLEYMINKPSIFALLLEGNDIDLEPILEWLMVKKYVDIENQEKYIPTEKGRKSLTLFLTRYTEFLNIFDIYCAVDLGSGEFAFDDYFDYQNTGGWKNFLDQERFEDLRIAVASFKKMDPVEIVFMSFINESRFGKDDSGWQFDLLLGTVWDEILDICNSALAWQELGYEDDEGEVPAKVVIEDVIKQGTEIMMNLHKQEASFATGEISHEGEDDDDDEEDTYVERVVIDEYPYDYYDPYWDPYYVSPLWFGLWLI